MKFKDVQKLEPGTKLYKVVLDVQPFAGTVRAEVVECEVREDKYGSGTRFVARPYTWRGQTEYRSTPCGFCYEHRYQAERELNARIVGLRDTLDRMSKTGTMQ